jgi:hypothetical protein
MTQIGKEKRISFSPANAIIILARQHFTWHASFFVQFHMKRELLNLAKEERE